jgi:hypothetical protein
MEISHASFYEFNSINDTTLKESCNPYNIFMGCEKHTYIHKIFKVVSIHLINVVQRKLQHMFLKYLGQE